jgi:hypothetical protein
MEETFTPGNIFRSLRDADVDLIKYLTLVP